MGYGNCCAPTFGIRRYYTKEEKVEWLKEYEQQLERELDAVKERLKEIKKE